MKNRKAFTLVELLVVIAILAVLATVSIVGYTSFSQKAKASNALTELTQAKEVINAELLVGEYEVTVDSKKYVFSISNDSLNVTKAGAAVGSDEIDAAIKACFPEIKDLKGTFTFSTGNKSLIYTLDSDAKAEWVVGTGELKNID